MGIQLDKVLSSDKLPSLPQVAMRIIKIAQQPEPDFADLVANIKVDPAICAKILKTVNSALFGFRHKCSSIEAAVPILGANLVRTLVLSFSLARHHSPAHNVTAYYQRLWRNSLAQAVAAELLADYGKSNDSDVFFLAGLLQDIGILALLSTNCDEYISEVLDHCRESNQVELEAQRLGFTHVDVSVELCRRWGLEDELIGAISRHHQPARKNDPNPANPSSSLTTALATAAQCSDHLATLQGHAAGDLTILPRILADCYLLGEDATYDLLHEVDLSIGQSAAIFSVDIGNVPPLDEILAAAKSTLEEIAIQAHMQAAAAERKAKHATLEVARIESSKRQLQLDAYRDPLTDAYNRQFMVKVLNGELERRLGEGTGMGFLFLDVDEFKAINDTYGHEMGDQALKLVARVLHDSTRESDSVIRYGGDEFLVVMTEITEQQLRAIATRVCDGVRKAPIQSETPIGISCSIGALCFTPAAGMPAALDELIRQVDRAMYAAKKRGGNQVHFYLSSGSCVPC